MAQGLIIYPRNGPVNERVKHSISNFGNKKIERTLYKFSNEENHQVIIEMLKLHRCIRVPNGNPHFTLIY